MQSPRANVQSLFISFELYYSQYTVRASLKLQTEPKHIKNNDFCIYSAEVNEKLNILSTVDLPCVKNA